jgi:hypothetical protein
MVPGRDLLWITQDAKAMDVDMAWEQLWLSPGSFSFHA